MALLLLLLLPLRLPSVTVPGTPNCEILTLFFCFKMFKIVQVVVFTYLFGATPVHKNCTMQTNCSPPCILFVSETHWKNATQKFHLAPSEDLQGAHGTRPRQIKRAK